LHIWFFEMINSNRIETDYLYLHLSKNLKVKR